VWPGKDIKFQSHPSKPSLSHEFKFIAKPTKPTTTQFISQPSQVSASQSSKAFPSPSSLGLARPQ
jgi:hypothetical protein